MVRNWDTIRAILVKLESAQTAQTAIGADQFPGIPPQEVAYHMALLKDAGLIEAKIVKSNTGDGAFGAAIATGLTWSGHEFLDTIRNDTIWTKIKATVKAKGLDLTFDVIKAAAGAVIKSMF